MNRAWHPLRGQSGFIIQEVVVAVLIFGIAMIPIIRGLRLGTQLAAILGEQGRLQSWRSAADGAIAEGLDPLNARLLDQLSGERTTDGISGAVGRQRLEARKGAAQISVLHETFGETAEQRSVSAGIEIGPSLAVVPHRVDPLPPLPPIRLLTPSISPASGTMVALGALVPGGSASAPYQAKISVTAGNAGALVKMNQSSPLSRSLQGSDRIDTTVDATELANLVRGTAWAEFNGDPTREIPVALDDGRTRWFVEVDGRTQVYEPSEALPFVLGVDLGRPALLIGSSEHLSGATVPVDIAVATKIERAETTAVLDYPADARLRFGSQWPAIAPSFRWSFEAAAIGAEGRDTRRIFEAASRPYWGELQSLLATPTSLLPGLRMMAGSWSLKRVSTALLPPERASEYYDGDTDAAGLVNFQAPRAAAMGRRLGRPEVDAVESVSETLSVLLLP